MSASEQSQGPLNMDKLNEAFMNNIGIIKQILGSFKESFDSFEAEFREAEKNGDTEVMSRLAHGLKGSAGNIRAESLSSLAAQLQSKIDGGSELGTDFDDLLGSLDQLNQQIDELIS